MLTGAQVRDAVRTFMTQAFRPLPPHGKPDAEGRAFVERVFLAADDGLTATAVHMFPREAKAALYDVMLDFFMTLQVSVDREETFPELDESDIVPGMLGKRLLALAGRHLRR